MNLAKNSNHNALLSNSAPRSHILFFGHIFALALLLLGVSGTAPTLAQGSRSQRAVHLVQQAVTAYNVHDYSRAVALCETAVSIDPNFARAYTWLGAAYQKRGNHQGAIEAFQRAVALDPHGADGERARRGLRELGGGGVAHVMGARLQRKLMWPCGGVLSVALSPDGRTVASASNDGVARIWDIANGSSRALSGNLKQVAFAPYGASLAGAGDSVKVLDATSGQVRFALPASSNSAVALAYSSDGALLAAVGADHTIKVWDVRSGQLLREFPNGQYVVNSIAISSRGYLAAGYGTDIRLWDVRSGQLLRTIIGDGSVVNAVAFSPSGQTLASGGGYKIHLWSPDTGRERKTLIGHRLSVSALAFAPDGRTLASGSYDTTIQLWNAESGDYRGSLKEHIKVVQALSFSRDGSLLASGGEDNTVCIWRLR